MRVGVCSYDLEPHIGGLGVVASAFVRHLRVANPLDAFITISPAPKANDRVCALASFFWKRRGGCPLFSLILFVRIPFLIRKHKLDLLHVHSGSGGVFLLRKPACPVVITSHHSYYQEAELVFKNNPLKRRWKRFMSLLEGRTYKLADHIVCVSKDTAEVVIGHFGIPRDKVTVIENGIEPRALPASPVKRRHQDILFVGRLEERKGVRTLLEAFKIFAIKNPKAELRFVGADLLGGELQESVPHDLKRRVHFIGYVHEPTLLRELRTAAVLVVPSLLEGFGLVVADAMQLGTCVIASRSPGLRCLIQDNQTGLLFETGDSASLVTCLEKVFADPLLATRIGHAAAEEAKKRFSYPDRARDLHAVFTKVIL